MVCSREHLAGVRRETGLPTSRILVEPARRNTAMAVGFAAVRIAREQPDALMVVLPADHVIPDAPAFAETIARGAAAAEGFSNQNEISR